MLSEDLKIEVGALIRRLEQRITLDPGYVVSQDPKADVLAAIEDAIVSLVVLHRKLSHV